MCILLFTTAHPDYSLILIDNRDEFILRPTSLPHWWNHPTSGEEVLSSRDLQRAAKGTWLGITKTGSLAVLTNYREIDQPVCGSRGRIVNAWLGGLADQGMRTAVHTIVKDGGVQGVGGFSMVCGKLRRQNEGIAIVSNRAADVNDVPIIDLEQDGYWGLSNTVYSDPEEWPKVTIGKRLLEEVVTKVISNKSSQDALIEELFSLLSHDTMPQQLPGSTLDEQMDTMRESIFVSPLGVEKNRQEMQRSVAKGRAVWADAAGGSTSIEEELARSDSSPDAKQPAHFFEEGMYGTQRQTVVLVDVNGNVTFVERALWDPNGNKLPRGEGDTKIRFRIDGWDD